jgi:hypothetical protein
LSCFGRAWFTSYHARPRVKGLKVLYRMDNKQIIKAGSRNFNYSVPVIDAGVTKWFHNYDLFPEARLFDYLDYINIINNSAQLITLYVNSHDDSYPVPSYMIQPVSRKAFRQFGIKNEGALATVAGDIVVSCRRLPPDVTQVVQTGVFR